MAAFISCPLAAKVLVFSSDCHCTRHYCDFHFDLLQFVSHLFVNKFNFLVCRSRKCHASSPARHHALSGGGTKTPLLASFICNLVILYKQFFGRWGCGLAEFTRAVLTVSLDAFRCSFLLWPTQTSAPSKTCIEQQALCRTFMRTQSALSSSSPHIFPLMWLTASYANFQCSLQPVGRGSPTPTACKTSATSLHCK